MPTHATQRRDGDVVDSSVERPYATLHGPFQKSLAVDRHAPERVRFSWTAKPVRPPRRSTASCADSPTRARTRCVFGSSRLSRKPSQAFSSQIATWSSITDFEVVAGRAAL